MAVPYTFGSATAAIPLSQLDSNFATTITLGNTAIQLGNTVTTLNNMTLANVTVSSGTLSVTTATATTANLVTINATTLNAATHRSDASLVLQTNGTTTAVTIDTAQNVGVGVTPSAWVSPALPAIDIGTMGAIAGQTSASNLHFVANGYLGSGPAWKYKTTNYSSRFTAGNDSGTGGFSWYTAPSGTAGNAITFTQAMTLDASGNLLVGTTTGPYNVSKGGSLTAGGGLGLADNGGNDVAYICKNGSTSGTYIKFYYNASSSGSAAGGSSPGSITTNGTGVTYGTASDYRLKENVAPMTGALATVAQLKPVTYNWKIDGSDGQGFIAHELQAVVPDCVTGEKDAVDADGNPSYQGIDTSFLVATLTAAIQEQQVLIQSLTDRLTALEGAAK